MCNKKSGVSKVGVGGGHEEGEQGHGEKRKGRGKNRRWEQGKGEKRKVRGKDSTGEQGLARIELRDGIRRGSKD